jgi:hypothetical protein
VAFYTMELLEGRDLGDCAPSPAARACVWLRDVASALAYLHARRLIHRDLTQRNVRLTADGAAKLIDFGVLTTVGAVAELAGTPLFVAPECIHEMQLDHRADLYALGALAYHLLTGRHAYPAREFIDLIEAWEEPPPPPSTLAPEALPPGLDDLVLALLSAEALARPASAAEVIDRLTALAQLPAAPQIEVERGYLQSAALVGRRREMERIEQALAKTSARAGSAIVVDAPSGTGKSRLLREAGLLGQLGGAAVAHVDCSDAHGAYGVFRALAKRLLEVCPAEAADAATAHAAVIGAIVPELLERLSTVSLAPRPADPVEERLRDQDGLSGWLLGLAKRRPLVLLVDDIQRCDEASAAALASLAALSTRAACARDVLGLRRSVEGLKRMCEMGYRLHDYLDLASGEYHRERGELGPAEEALRRALAQLNAPLLEQPILAALSETMLARGELDEGKELARRGIGDTKAGAHKGLPSFRLRCERALALAEASAGDTAAAVDRLERALGAAERYDSPTIGGQLHEALALVAHQAGDGERYRRELARLEACFRPTRNPALLGRLRRLEALASAPASHVRPRTMAIEAVTQVQSSDVASRVGAVLGGCRGPVERAASALELRLEAAGAASGMLFLLQGGAPVLAAPAFAAAPGPEVERLLADVIAGRASPEGGLALLRTRGGELIGVALLDDALGTAQLDGALAAVAEALARAGDAGRAAQTTTLRAPSAT